MLTTQVQDSTNLVTIDYSGALDADELIAARQALKKVIEEHGTVRLLVRYGDIDMHHVELRALWEDLKNAALIGHIERCAIVADQQWLRVVSDAAGAVLPPQIETFSLCHYDTAREWVNR